MVSKGEDAVERAGKAVLTAALPLNRCRDLGSVLPFQEPGTVVTVRVWASFRLCSDHSPGLWAGEDLGWRLVGPLQGGERRNHIVLFLVLEWAGGRGGTLAIRFESSYILGCF